MRVNVISLLFFSNSCIRSINYYSRYAVVVNWYSSVTFSRSW